jgi:hypothetical protein
MVDEAQFGDQSAMKGKLKLWRTRKITDAEMMLFIEQQAKAGKVNPQWLHEGETQREKENMLKMGQDDHMRLPAVPLPPKNAPPRPESRAEEQEDLAKAEMVEDLGRRLLRAGGALDMV